MTKYALIVDDEQLAHLRDVMILNVSEVSHDHAEAMKNTGDKLGAQTTRVVFMRATVILAMLDDPPPIAERSSFDVSPIVMPYTHAELRAAEAAGVDVNKEYGPINPQAFRPRCVHGLYFTEHCTHCADVPEPRCEHGAKFSETCSGCDRVMVDSGAPV